MISFNGSSVVLQERNQKDRKMVKAAGLLAIEN
jgi:hypothetical protein